METNLFPPPSAELLQKIEDLNAGLVSLKTLAGAVSQSEVRSLAETEDGVRLTFCDGTEVTVAWQCGGGSAADRHCRSMGMRITGHSPRKRIFPG